MDRSTRRRTRPDRRVGGARRVGVARGEPAVAEPRGPSRPSARPPGGDGPGAVAGTRGRRRGRAAGLGDLVAPAAVAVGTRCDRSDDRSRHPVAPSGCDGDQRRAGDRVAQRPAPTRPLRRPVDPADHVVSTGSADHRGRRRAGCRVTAGVRSRAVVGGPLRELRRPGDPAPPRRLRTAVPAQLPPPRAVWLKAPCRPHGPPPPAWPDRRGDRTSATVGPGRSPG